MIEAGCLVVDTLWCSKTSFANGTTCSFCLLKTGSSVKIFSVEKMSIRYQWFFRSFNKQLLLSRLYWTIAALNRSFLERLSLFSPISLTILSTVETESFFFSSSLVIFLAWVVFEGLFDGFWTYNLSPEVFLIEDVPLGLQTLLNSMNSHSSDVQLLWINF